MGCPMTDLRPAERRKERRYIVCGVESWIDGRPSQIIDISRSGVRLLLPPGFAIDNRRYDVVFDIPEDGAVHPYRVTGRLVRFTDIYVVLTYDPPCAHWEALLLSLDTFEMTRLGAL
jgi:hypothetical protein